MSTVDEETFKVLFLCTGNSARSIMAEAILNREGAGRFRAFSAGSQPKGQVHPVTLDLLRDLKFDVNGLRSKGMNEFIGPKAPHFDLVVTVCDNAAGEACPLWPGQPMKIHWSIPDPAAAMGSDAAIRQAFADAFQMLFRRILRLVSLPVRSLDRNSLQKQLEAIGEIKDDGHAPPSAA